MQPFATLSKWSGALLLALVAMYAVAAAVLGLMPVHKDFRSAPNGVRVYLHTNGVHADLVLPVATAGVDWRSAFGQQQFKVDVASADYISFGWGDRGVYVDAKSWRDLSAAAALKALTGRGQSAMHVAFANTERVQSKGQGITINAAQYGRLVAYIEQTFKRSDSGFMQPIVGASYWGSDAFYEAHGSYSAFATCNDWVRGALDHAGIRTARWSPFDVALFYQLRQTLP